MLIYHLKLEPIDAPAIPDGFLRMSDGKITEIGAMEALQPMEGEESIDGKGAFALPGLVDAHCHLGLFGDSMGFEGDDGNETSDPVTPQLRAIDGINALDRGFAEAVDAGITTVITGPGSANAICGQIAALKTVGCCVDDMAIVPMLAMKMALGENPKGTYAPRSQSPSTRMATAALIREELACADRYREDMERFEEDTEDEIDPPEYDAKCEALLPVLRREIPVHFHAHRVDDIFTAARIAKEFSLNCVIIHGSEAHLVAERFAQCGLPVVCGPIIGARTKPELLGMSRANPALLHRQGVKLAICTDHPEVPIDLLLLSAALAHREGMSRADALAAITLCPAEICGLADRIGSLTPGKDADVIFFEHDPIGGLEKPFMVFLNGKRVK